MRSTLLPSIHWGAWKDRSPNFGLRGFYELRVEGLVGLRGPDAPLSIAHPTTPEISEAARMPIVAASISSPSPKAKSVTNRLFFATIAGSAKEVRFGVVGPGKA
jgi:hypothetical protein